MILASFAPSPTTLHASLLRDLAFQLAPIEPDPSAVPWSDIARPSQLPPSGDWRFWLLMAGRGFGKTRTGAEYVCAEIQAGRAREVMLIAATAADVRDVVVEGPSGILKVCERLGWKAHYEPSKQRITFPNGAVARTRSADEPDRIRGPECDVAWWDEYGTWKHRDAYTNADLGLRRRGPNGERARAVVTFTPKPTKLVKELLSRPDAVIQRGSTLENADNLDTATLTAYQRQYEGTRLGRQELGGELLEDVEGALWKLAQIDAARLKEIPDGVSLTVVAVGSDPAATARW
jgi:phage terminase large subunit-like protein